MASSGEQPVRVGVLALQGAFIEHVKMLNSLPNVEAREVRSPVSVLPFLATLLCSLSLTLGCGAWGDCFCRRSWAVSTASCCRAERAQA
jgi:hypothetical protein